jgi:hypothetical protein
MCFVLAMVGLMGCGSDNRGDTYKLWGGNALRNNFFENDGPTDIKALRISKIDSLLVSKGISGSPIFYDNSDLVITSHNGRVVYIREGEPNWIFTVDSDAQWLSTPASDSAGNIFFCAGSNEVYCVSGKGKLIWKTALERGPNIPNSGPRQEATSPLICCGHLFTGTSAGWIYCLTLDGTVEWKFQTNKPMTSPMAFSGTDGIIFATTSFQFSGTDTLFWLKSDGKLAWKIPLPNVRLYAGPAVDFSGNALVAGSVDTPGGREHHLFSVSDHATVNWEVKCDVVVHGITIDRKDNIYVSGYVLNATDAFSKVTCFNDSGRIKWDTKLDAVVDHPAVVSRNGYLYVYGANAFLDQEVRRAVYVFGVDGNWIDSHNLSSYKSLDFAPVLNSKRELAFVSKAEGAILVFSSPSWNIDFLGGESQEKK